MEALFGRVYPAALARCASRPLPTSEPAGSLVEA
jgi:hypothetical protein